MAKNEYDDMKGMLNKLRNINEQADVKRLKQLSEQVESQQSNPEDQQSNPENQEQMPSPEQNGNNESEDIFVINNVDIEVKSSDSGDLGLSDDEKGKISQLIDDLRSTVSETVEIEKIDIYPNNIKLTGAITNVGINFILSNGDEDGLYFVNSSMIKVDEGLLDIIHKLNDFKLKYDSLASELIINRKEN